MLWNFSNKYKLHIMLIISADKFDIKYKIILILTH